MARLTITPQAERDLIGLWSYIARESSSARADAFLDKIRDKLKLLAENPALGRPRDELRSNVRSHPVGRYIIFYFPMDDGIDIVRVLYGGRDLDAAFEDATD